MSNDDSRKVIRQRFARTIRISSFVILSSFVISALAPAADPPKPDAVDKSVRQALVYLQRSQEPEGGWRALGSTRTAGVSGLCTMAFLSAGHTPTEGPFAKTVTDGIRYVMSRQQSNGVIASDANFEMYHHGICTLMLAEVVGMTKGDLAEQVRQRLARAVSVILRAQRTEGTHRGGWRYRVEGSDGDLSVTGWQLLALRAAKNVGCDVPASAIDRAVEYIQRCYDQPRGAFAYVPRGQLTVACAGTGILCLELCGKQLHRAPQSLLAAGYVLRRAPRFEDQHCFYGLYYNAQAMFQLGDPYWSSFRPNLHNLLLRGQNDNGSWYGVDGEARMVGPNYTTAMSVLALTVEYRFLPIYQRGEEPEADGKPPATP